MECPWDDVMTEAFRRAQIAGRVFPLLCDFPPSVPRDVAEIKYLMPLRELSEAGRGGTPMHTVPLWCGPLEVTGFSESIEDEEESLFMTYGGDAWATALLLASQTRSGGGGKNFC
ncbi:hypothetical protein, conserved [Leishmania tarentolae]|uniref:Uncharacterized protein n=1 Tax=Leishmania tarentolae TaxID=5689 RepID=A0A640KNP9_LEITA|nr:hypothetical protein, conserved [Leishmania tarentolae]